jgi:PAS domain S-box-containing protein
MASSPGKTTSKSALPSTGMIAIAAGLVAAHVASLIIFRGSRGADNFSDFLTVAASIYTAYACFIAIGRSHGLARKFWQLTGTSFVLWALGKCIWLYDFYVLGLTAVPIVPLLIFFLSVAPMFVVIFTSEPQSSKSLNWEGLLDAIQILSLILFAYLFLVYVPLLYKGEPTVRMMEDELLLWRNVLLAVGLLVRAIFSRSSYIRRLYLPIALIMGFYAATTWVANRAQSATDHAPPLYDLAWTIPFCMVAVVAILWRQSPDEPGDVLRPQRLTGVIFAYAPSLALPAMLLLMKPQVVGAQISLALVGLMFSIILFNVRLAVTQRRQRLALEALSISERKYQSLFERNMAGVYRSTVAGRLLDCNPTFAAMFGYSREELLQLPMQELHFEGVEGRDGFISDLRATGFQGPREGCFRRKDGSSLWIVQNVILEKLADGNEVLEGTMLDITERRALEAQFRQAQKMEAIGRLAGGVAHDFNNLLTVINGYSAMQLERTAKTDPVHHQAQQIRAAADRAAALTRQLLAFSRQQVLEPRRVNLNETVHDMEKMLRRLIGENIEVHTSLASNLGTVEVDPSQIDQILMNLVVNARDAMPNGGKLTIQTENVELDETYAKKRGYSNPGRHVMLAVSDSGTGMSPETLSRIFEPFFTTKEPGKGTGLGMSMVYGSVKQSGGSIDIYSELNQGTTVKIYLPRVDAVVDEAPDTEDAEVSALHGSERILLIEDDVALRRLAIHVLNSHGYTVQAVEKVEELHALLQNAAPCDLLLTDVVMPGLKGPELAMQVAQCWPKTKILYMSGYTGDAILHQGVINGEFQFLQKPFTPDALAAKVREVLDTANGTQSSSASGSH